MYRAYDKILRRHLEICEECEQDDSEFEMDRFSDCVPISQDDQTGQLCQVPGCGAYRDARPGSPLYRPHLFSLTEAKDDFTAAQGAAETALASAKIVAKTVANLGVMGAKTGFKILKRMPGQMESRMDAQLKRTDLTEDQRHRSELMLKRLKERKTSGEG